MKALFTSFVLLAGFIPATSFAAAETLKLEESVEINAKAETVWANVSNFGDLGLWHPAIKSTQIVSGTPNLPGVIRLLTLQDNSQVKEELLTFSPAQKTFSYKILEGVLPVSNYRSTVTVKALSDSKTKVTWNGDFKRKDLSDKPVANQTDDDAIKTMTVVYRSGLDNLKKISEGR
ncbi:MAG TPA: SRPBCC family protein [Methylophilus sp.]|nr:SRPBCC family protein [Methylophilus sp.]